MCAFSKSITSKDISHAVRGLKGMYNVELLWRPVYAKEALQEREIPEQCKQVRSGLHVRVSLRLGKMKKCLGVELEMHVG